MSNEPLPDTMVGPPVHTKRWLVKDRYLQTLYGQELVVSDQVPLDEMWFVENGIITHRMVNLSTNIAVGGPQSDCQSSVGPTARPKRSWFVSFLLACIACGLFLLGVWQCHGQEANPQHGVVTAP